MRTARETNAAIPAHTVDILAHHLGDLTSSRVAVLGAAYRGGCKEAAFSGAFNTVSALEERGAVVSVHDPLYSDLELAALGFVPHSFASKVDAVIIHTDQLEYANLTSAYLPGARVLPNGRASSHLSLDLPPKQITLGRAG